MGSQVDKSKSIIIGYEAGDMSPDAWADWSEARRQQYLLRLDVETPLSTDTCVWPSVFDTTPQLTRPSWTGPLGPWDRISRLHETLRTARLDPPKPCWYVAISVLRNSITPRAARLYLDWPSLWPEPASEFDEPWESLGFDVSDYFLMSGLTNCGYDEGAAMIRRYRRRFGHELNEHHLFESDDAALRFKRAVDRRVEEHAPFFVYCLWLVTKTQVG